MRVYVENAQSLRLNHLQQAPDKLPGLSRPRLLSANRGLARPTNMRRPLPAGSCCRLPRDGPDGLSSSPAIYRPRCEACYFVKRGNISYVYCKTHPRHKQRQGPKHIQGSVERPTAGFTHWTTRGVSWT